MGNPTRVYFIREAVFLSQPAQLEYWKGSDFGFSTLEEFANEASEKIRLLQPTTAEEMALLFSELGEFYNLEEFFDDIFTSSYTDNTEAIDRYGAIKVAYFENWNFFCDIEENKTVFTPAIQKRIDMFPSLSAISLPPMHYSSFQCLVHIRKSYGMELFEWHEMDEFVNSINYLLKKGVWNRGDHLYGYGDDWKQIIDMHHSLQYDYAVFWSFV